MGYDIKIHLPRSNSSFMIVLVDMDTLNEEFCCGYAGVMMGIR